MDLYRYRLLELYVVCDVTYKFVAQAHEIICELHPVETFDAQVTLRVLLHHRV